jgi:nucleotide-binding universal stress UspA family protein
MFPINTILHPTDFTEHSHYALQMAHALARDYGAKLVVLHVFPTPGISVYDGGFVSVPMEIPRENLLSELNEIRFPDLGVPIERVLIEGDPAFEILRAAEKYDANLIVMGTHGRGGLSRLLMGSVAGAVTRKAKCPVLTLRTKIDVNRPAPTETAHQVPVEIC